MNHKARQLKEEHKRRRRQEKEERQQRLQEKRVAKVDMIQQVRDREQYERERIAAVAERRDKLKRDEEAWAKRVAEQEEMARQYAEARYQAAWQPKSSFDLFGAMEEVLG